MFALGARSKLARSSPSCELGRRVGELSEEAQEQVERIDAWWRENRQAAPDLFTDELDQALRALEHAPGLGVRYPPRPNVQRLLVKRTHFHLYVVEEEDRVYVLAVWSAFRGRGPLL
jgi:plasmid stabilization system protein ParE